MHKNIIIYGGYNWIGYYIISSLLNEFTNFIIVDSFQNQLWKDNIKDKFDNFRYLFDENIFLYNVDIKDKYRLETIYKTFNITHVINNIKYNINDLYVKDKAYGYRNICELNIDYKVEVCVCLYRHITHNSFALNHSTSNHVLMCGTFNQAVQEINSIMNNHMKIYHIEFYDYIFGFKKDKYNDIVSIYKNIIKSESPCYVQKCSFFAYYDEDILDCIKNLLLETGKKIDLVKRNYEYIQLYETLYYYITKDCINKDKIIINDKELISYIKE